MVELIKEKVSKYFNVNNFEHPSKTESNTNARHVYIFLLCENTKLTLKAIANLVGRKDHSTVIHARDKVRGLIELKKINKLDKKSAIMLDKIESIQKDINEELIVQASEIIQNKIDEEIRILKARKIKIANLISENPNMAEHLTIELCAIDDILTLRKVII